MTSRAPTFLSATQAWFRFLLLGAILGGLVALAATLLAPPDYTAKVTLLVTPPKSSTIDYGGIQATQALAPTFAELATTTPVLERVIASTQANTDPTKLAAAVSTHVPVGTSLIEISVSDKDAQMAANLANAIGNELVNYQEPGGSPEVQALQVTLSVVDPAAPPASRSGPGILISVALGAAIGLFIEIGLVFLLENLRTAGREGSEGDSVADGPAAAQGASPSWPTGVGVTDADRRLQGSSGR